MKRAQVLTQVFIYIAAAAIFLGLLLFGYRFTLNLLESQDTVLISDFGADLQAKVDQLRVRRGSVTLENFRLPPDFRILCIADSTGQSALGLSNEYPQFANAWRANSENVFLLPKQDIPLYIDNVEIEQGWFCMPIEGAFTLRMEGTGRTVRISPT